MNDGGLVDVIQRKDEELFAALDEIARLKRLLSAHHVSVDKCPLCAALVKDEEHKPANGSE